MSDLAHSRGQRLQLAGGSSLEEVFASAVKHGGDRGEPPAAEPRASARVRRPAELQAVIEEAKMDYRDCGKLSVSLDWWNCDSDDSAWQVTAKPAPARPS